MNHIEYWFLISLGKQEWIDCPTISYSHINHVEMRHAYLDPHIFDWIRILRNGNMIHLRTIEQSQYVLLSSILAGTHSWSDNTPNIIRIHVCLERIGYLSLE